VNQYVRTLADAAARWGWDIKSSPYSPLVSGFDMINGVAWPLLAGALGQGNPFMRPDYFSLAALLAPTVDWPLVASLGDFASIPLEVQRWVRTDLEAALYPPDAPSQQGYRADRAAIEWRIEDKLDALDRVHERLDVLGIAPDALLRAALGRWQRPPPRYTREGMQALSDAVHAVTRYIPHLMLGAVELHDGDFTVFSSERAPEDGGISLDAVLASAAVPWLFRAQEMDGTDPDTLAPRRLALWDGLFSQNPPLRNFLSGLLDETRKPDEIWVVQINPSKARTAPGASGRDTARLDMSGGEIWDLRNALAGNLSLNQEIGFVDAINRRMETPNGEAGDTPAATAQRMRDKLVQVDRIIMDGAAIEADTGMTLGANSKVDRDPRLKDALYRHGSAQARRYLALRRQVGVLCGALADTLVGACASAAGIDAAGADAGACRVTPMPGAMVVDGATLYSVHGPAPRALVRWRSVDAQVDGQPVRIEGRSELADDAPDSVWRVTDVKISAVMPLKGTAQQPAAARLAAWTDPARAIRPQ
jgi:predicted acylesterase/phospholipase RssA